MDDEKTKERKALILEVMSKKEYKPLKLKELAYLLGVDPGDRGVLRKILSDMALQGSVICDSTGRYQLPEKDTFTGTFIGNARGFGFVEVEGLDQDLFVGKDHVHDAFHGDTVQVKLLPEKTGKRPEAEVIKVLARGTDEIVGTFADFNENYGTVKSDNKKLSQEVYIPRDKSKNAMEGHKVVVKITSYGDDSHAPEGEVTEILGHVNDPGVDILSVVRSYGIPDEYPKPVMEQAERVPESLTASDMEGRLDLRDVPMVTIDGPDAKDLDDAVSVRRDGDGYVLGVHIADVSHYVTEGSPLDKEAIKRGTSVYLVDRVIPMLPHALSNGICSLNHDVDRLALSCIMKIDSKGKIKDHKIAETVVRINHRMTYDSVAAIIERDDPEETAKYSDFADNFKLMYELSKKLRANRHKRGAIDFDFPEAKIELDDKGFPVSIHPEERNEATKMIEDFMLAANETVAEDFYWQEIPFLYRTHDAPDSEKIESLSSMLANFNYYLKEKEGQPVHPKEFQKLLENIHGKPEEGLISMLVLRSMKQAKYTVECTGHFGLAARYYCHFTSPIRRYPDLQIHRIIKEKLEGRLSEKRINHYEKILSGIADSCSKNERRADDAERDVDKLKKVQYMTRHIGERFTGTVSGVTSYGIYVELPSTVEGMVSVASMADDYYYFEEKNYRLVGKENGREYHLGDQVDIIVKNADPEFRIIDFVLADNSVEAGDDDRSHIEDDR